MIIEKIFEGNLSPSQIVTSNYFNRGLFLFFTTDQPDNIGFDLGMTLIIELNHNNRLDLKEIPLFLSERNVASTFDCAYIPLEYSSSSLDCYCAFNSGINIEKLTVWVARLETSLEEIGDQITDLQNAVNAQLGFDIAQAVNAIQQNLTLGAIGAGLAPLTLGATAVTLPTLTASTTSLAGAITTAQLLLLP